MINDTLYAKYMRERDSVHVLENEVSFVSYKIVNQECFICDMYVIPEKRTIGQARSMVSKLADIGQASGCNVITANIDLRDKNANSTLIAALNIGFDVISGSAGVLLIAKKIKEGDSGRAA